MCAAILTAPTAGMPELNKREQSPHYIPELDPENPDRKPPHDNPWALGFVWVACVLVTVIAPYLFWRQEQYVNAFILLMWGVFLLLVLVGGSRSGGRNSSHSPIQRFTFIAIPVVVVLTIGAVVAGATGNAHLATLLTVMACMTLAPFLVLATQA